MAPSPSKKQRKGFEASRSEKKIEECNKLIAEANEACEESGNIFTPLLNELLEDQKKLVSISKIGIVSPLLAISSFFY